MHTFICTQLWFETKTEHFTIVIRNNRQTINFKFKFIFQISLMYLLTIF